MTLKWYMQRQNNSGGVFRKPACEVYVQAESLAQAEDRAFDIDLDNSDSCSCCGCRWYGFSDYEAAEHLPEVVMESVCYDPEECPAGMAFPLGDDVGFILPQKPYELRVYRPDKTLDTTA